MPLWGSFPKRGRGSNSGPLPKVEKTVQSTKTTAPSTAKTVQKQGAVLRVAGTPPPPPAETTEDWDNILRILKSSFSEALSGETFDIKATLSQSCYDNTRTALVSSTPPAPPELNGLANGGTLEIPYNGTRKALIIDKDFYGLTQLYQTNGKVQAE
ncbi:uncharacterized protein LAJ45_10087 [Morchella importuna]|uniref:uncharacterized protein n=1 Tax=Morchella importuna TaxID=1174673 RepID=UPI001E8EEAE5|nr:uncharacterized protein LAJ45_10087 [Morchella importuna]KAH8145945.1 hypothetical protein LAJ45_10087 [Morchella importuna]